MGRIGKVSEEGRSYILEQLMLGKRSSEIVRGLRQLYGIEVSEVTISRYRKVYKDRISGMKELARDKLESIPISKLEERVRARQSLYEKLRAEFEESVGDVKERALLGQMMNRLLDSVGAEFRSLDEMGLRTGLYQVLKMDSEEFAKYLKGERDKDLEGKVFGIMGGEEVLYD